MATCTTHLPVLCR